MVELTAAHVCKIGCTKPTAESLITASLQLKYCFSSAVLPRQGSPKRDLSTHSAVLTFHLWLPLARTTTAL